MPTQLPLPFLRALPLAALLGLGILPACASGPDGAGGERLGSTESALTKAERVVRYGKMRDAATARGIDGRGYLFAGIAMDETGLAMCWSEATWACQGPHSPDCNGPIIAGSADGPCSAQQGGLGMFQFDAGTYSQTVSQYGSNVLTIDGQVSHAIDYVINMVKKSNYTTNAETDAKAKQWINDFDINNAKLRDEWIKTVVNYYNGCPPGASCWSARYKTYNDALQQVIDETGLPFWMGTPDYKADYVGQSFPLAAQPFDLYPGQSKAGYIDLKNDGKVTWKKGEVFLGTSDPRDAKSPLAGSDWVSPSRATTVDKDTAPGAVGRFSFTVHAPAKAGDYAQHFNLVREGVHWFSDAGQGGPPDNQLEVNLTVKASKCPAGIDATFSCDGADRVKCADPATGVVTKEVCPGTCEMKGATAECVADTGAGGAGGAGGTHSGGAAGAAGHGGAAAPGGHGGVGGEAAGAHAGASGTVGSAGKGSSAGGTSAAGTGGATTGSGGDSASAGAAGADGTVTLADDAPAGSEGGCSIGSEAPARGTGGMLLGLGLAAAACGRRNRKGDRSER